MLATLISKMEPYLLTGYRRLACGSVPNLQGDRDIEYSWISGHCPEGPGRGLDFGCGRSYLSLVAVRRGFEMTAVDLAPVQWSYADARLRFVRGNILDTAAAPEGSLDLVLCCSAIEHVGLSRYGNRLDQNGDLKAMGRLRSLLKAGGTMLLTIPVGMDTVVEPRHRVYGTGRLPLLLMGFEIKKHEFWTKDKDNRWRIVHELEALHWRPTQNCYALGCFVLSNKGDRKSVV